MLVVFGGGGWGPTVVVEPKPDSPCVDMEVGGYMPFGSGALGADPSRQAVTDFFTNVGSRSAVINGINVPAIAHGGCRARILTGTRDRAMAPADEDAWARHVPQNRQSAPSA